MNWEREMYQERSWTWTLNPGSKASGCVEEFRLQEHYLAVQQKRLYQSRWWRLSHSGGCSVQVLRLWIRNKCMLKICSLLVYLSNLDIHISMRLTQLIQTDRKATEKTNNKQACTNLKDLQMVLSGCLSTIPLEGRNMYQMTSVRWMSRPFPSMLISIKHFSPALRYILISCGPASWTAVGGLYNYWEVQSVKENEIN